MQRGTQSTRNEWHIFMQAIGCQDVVLFALPNANKQTNKPHVKAKQRCRDGVMSDFVSWCRHSCSFLLEAVKTAPVMVVQENWKNL